MSSYRRPDIKPLIFRDASGDVIPYGNRWGSESPPEETYSVLSKLERFRPLQQIADALIEGLIADYDVTVEEGVALASDLMHVQDDVTRAVRITPADAQAAPLTFVFTALPWVVIHAGLLHDLLYPVCSCDACDEDWERLSESMERDVAAIVGGGYSEGVDPSRGLGVSFRIVGMRSGSGRPEDATADRLADAVPILAALEDGWAAWPARRG